MDMSYCLGMAKEASMPATVEDDDTLLAARATSDIVRDAHCMADMVAAFFRAQGLHFRRKRSGFWYGTAEGGPTMTRAEEGCFGDGPQKNSRFSACQNKFEIS